MYSLQHGDSIVVGNNMIDVFLQGKMAAEGRGKGKHSPHVALCRGWHFVLYILKNSHVSARLFQEFWKSALRRWDALIEMSKNCDKDDTEYVKQQAQNSVVMCSTEWVFHVMPCMLY